jgi:hypothetical protein
MSDCVKTRFNKVEAQQCLNKLLKKGTFKEGFGRIYCCGHCGYWHLTSQPMESKKDEDISLQYVEKWEELINNNHES